MNLKIENKFGMSVSLAALVVAVVAFSSAKKTDSVKVDETKIKEIVIDTIKHNPQLIMDSMGEGIAKKREEAVKQLAEDVKANKDEISTRCMKFGSLGAKSKVICFFDPLCKHCGVFQRSMLEIIKSAKEIEFELVPLAALNEDSVTVAKVYIAAYEIDHKKCEKFIKNIIQSGGSLDKNAIEKALSGAGFSSGEVEKKLPGVEELLKANEKLAQKIKLPVVPGVFFVKNDVVSMAQEIDVESIVKFFENK